MGLSIDREKVIKGLEICYCPPSKCEDCPYHDLPDEQSCNDVLCLDALATLKEQPQIVRCKDCKYWSAERMNDFNKCRRWINVGVKNFATMGDWFCADGKEREVDD